MIRMRRSFGVVAVLAALSGCIQSESSLRSNFYGDRAAFEEMLELFAQDDHLVRVANDFTRLKHDWSWPREDVGLTPERWDRYRALFARARLDGGIERQGTEVFFYMSSVGLVGSGRSRGVAFATSRPLETARTLGERQGEGISYVALEGNWYLFDWSF